MGGLCFETSSWSDHLLDRYYKSSNPMGALIREGTDKQRRYMAHAQDMHAALYLRNEPKARPGAPDWARKALDTAHDLPEWQRLRQRCASSPLAAAIATETMLRATLDKVPDQNAPQEKPQKQPQGQGEGQGGQGQQPQPQDGPGDGNGSQERNDMRNAISDAQQQISDAENATEQLAAALGINPGTDPTRPPTEEDQSAMLELYNLIRNNPDFIDIANLAGRMRLLARATQKTKVKKHVREIEGVAPRQPDILPSELVGLRAGRYARLETLARIASGEALGYKRKPHREKLAKGPFIVLLDVSGSMGAYKRINYAKAVTLALAARAQKEGRTFAAISFNGGIQATATYRKGERDPQGMAAILSQGAYGGTSFDAALDRAIKTIDADPNRYQRADIVLVTDGEDSIDPDIKEELTKRHEQSGTVLYVVAIGSEAHRLTYGHDTSVKDTVQATEGEIWQLKDGALDQTGQALAPLLHP